MSGFAIIVGLDSGAALIAAERQRQVTAEGWTAEHDAEHTDGELILAALCYLVAAERPFVDPDAPSAFDTPGEPPADWPWAPEWWKPSTDPARNLVKAGALIAAELDRLAAGFHLRHVLGADQPAEVTA